MSTGRRGRAARAAAEDGPAVAALLDERAAVLDVLDRVSTLSSTSRTIRDATGAQAAFVADLPERDGPAVIRWTSGTRGTALSELVVPTGRGIGGQVLATGGPAAVPDYLTSSRITHHYDAPVSAEGLGAMIAVPVTSRSGDIVALAYAARRGDGAFGDVALDQLRGVAAQAGAALDVAAGVEHRLREAVADERRRMQLAMHDSVGAMLFSIGAQVHDLHEASRRNPALGRRLRRIEADVSAASAALRESLLALGEARSEPHTAAAVAAAAHCRSFESRTGVPARLVELTALPTLDTDRTAALVAAVREGLANAEKHARASSVVVSIGVCGGGVQVAVSDDGSGDGPADACFSSGLGVAALSERAENLGGRVSLVRDTDGATLRTWVPLDGEAAS
ncbi:GAF domain-containing sensor histidine kinase [Rhodococcus aerolatus]